MPAPTAPVVISAPDPSEDADTVEVAERSPISRAGWCCFGLAAVGVGGVGVVVPGLPTTVFFIIAAWAFSKSSPRLEAWVLGLPRIGQLVQDYRDGAGMPRRAKAIAISMITFFCGLSAYMVAPLLLTVLIPVVGLIGIAYIVWFVPTQKPKA